jgi:hypothetical protein
MTTLTKLALFLGGGLALVACVRMTTVTGALRDRDRRTIREYRDGKLARTTARRCHLAAVDAADSVARGPVLLTTGAAASILASVEKECDDGSPVDGGRNRPVEDLGRRDGVGPQGTPDGGGGRSGDEARRGDLGSPDGGTR